MRTIIAIIAILALTQSVLSASCKVSRSCPLYKQCDPAWGNNRLGDSSTICKVGCLMSAVAMGMAGAGKNINGARPTPATLNQFLLANKGYTGIGYMWRAVERFGMVWEGWSNNKAVINAALCANKIVILHVNGGRHWVLATGFTDNVYQVQDAGYNRGTYTAGEVVSSGIYRLT